MPARALSFLCFAKEKKAKERRLRAQVWLRQTSLSPHGFSGGLATCGYAASNMQALVPRKTTLRSAVPAGTAQPNCFSQNFHYRFSQEFICRKSSYLLQWHALPPLFVKIPFGQPALHPLFHLRPVHIQHGKPGGIAVAAFIYDSLAERSLIGEA